VSSELKQIANSVNSTIADIAAKMGTGFLRCDNCSRKQDLTVELARKYLASGWPVCCEGTFHGGTMGYHRADERGRL
jgi:hypothetical protein